MSVINLSVKVDLNLIGSACDSKMVQRLKKLFSDQMSSFIDGDEESSDSVSGQEAEASVDELDLLE